MRVFFSAEQIGKDAFGFICLQSQPISVAGRCRLFFARAQTAGGWFWLGRRERGHLDEDWLANAIDCAAGHPPVGIVRAGKASHPAAHSGNSEPI